LSHQDENGAWGFGFTERSGGKAVAMNVLDLLLVREQNKDRGTTW